VLCGEMMCPARLDRAYALFEALKRHIQLVVIELEEDDDPQIIFETLNARGAPLLPSDLIRNFVFQRATRQGENPEHLYNTLWAEYDERPAEAGAGTNERFWKQMDRQGRVKRTRLDLFMHHYVQYRSAQEHSIGHLFQAFRSWWQSATQRTVSDELKELRRHSDVFAKVLVPDDDGRTALFAKRLQTLDTSTVYPVLLLLLVGSKERVVAGDLDVVAGLRSVGVVDALAAFYQGVPGHGPNLGVVGVTSALGSAVVDNHPMSILNMMALHGDGNSRPLLAALIGGDIGPRLLPIGSLAGLLWMDLLRRRGLEIKLRTFVRLGTLVLIPTLALSLLMLWALAR
jgi:hypothetical protein